MFHEDRAEYTRYDGDLVTSMTVLVSAEDDSEVRRITLSNTGRRAREIEITSYAELSLAPQSADVAHPGFSKLFVQTERLPGSGALLAGRRQREPEEEGDVGRASGGRRGRELSAISNSRPTGPSSSGAAVPHERPARSSRDGR